MFDETDHFGKRKVDFSNDAEFGNSSLKKSKNSRTVRFGENEVVFLPDTSSAINNFELGPDEQDDDEDLEKAKKKRGAVNLQGYDSDDEEAEKFVDNDDMFAESAASLKKGGNSFGKLDEETREAQEWAGGDLGVEFEPFNMDQELEEGGFDENGHYVSSKDENVFHDRWLQGVTDEEIRKAKLAQDRRIAREEASSNKNLKTDENSLLLLVLRHMNPREDIFA
ncbi:hypothetical protein HK096_010084, partial [Nowakowskiella sp. JEL0078]